MKFKLLLLVSCSLFLTGCSIQEAQLQASQWWNTITGKSSNTGTITEIVIDNGYYPISDDPEYLKVFELLQKNTKGISGEQEILNQNSGLFLRLFSTPGALKVFYIFEKNNKKVLLTIPYSKMPINQVTTNNHYRSKAPMIDAVEVKPEISCGKNLPGATAYTCIALVNQSGSQSIFFNFEKTTNSISLSQYPIEGMEMLDFFGELDTEVEEVEDQKGFIQDNNVRFKSGSQITQLTKNGGKTNICKNREPLEFIDPQTLGDYIFVVIRCKNESNELYAINIEKKWSVILLPIEGGFGVAYGYRIAHSKGFLEITKEQIEEKYNYIKKYPIKKDANGNILFQKFEGNEKNFPLVGVGPLYLGQQFAPGFIPGKTQKFEVNNILSIYIKIGGKKSFTLNLGMKYDGKEETIPLGTGDFGTDPDYSNYLGYFEYLLTGGFMTIFDPFNEIKYTYDVENNIVTKEQYGGY